MVATSKPLSLRGIRTFWVAARHGSFRKAADELFVTASAVSHQVKRLENELEVELFDRDGRSIALTPAGQLLFEEAGQAIPRLDDIAAHLRSGYRRASLRVSVQPFFASEIFVPRLTEFTEANPHIDIHVDTSDEASDRHPPDADVSIRVFREPPPNLYSELILPFKLVPACSPGFRASLNIVGWHLSKAVPMVLHASRPNAWKRWSEHSGIPVPQTTNMIRLDSMIAVVRAAERGVGAALVPVPLADDWFETGKLVRLFDYELVTSDGYYFVCEPELLERPDIKGLRDWMITAFDFEA